MLIDQREDILARYMVGRWRLGYEDLALYIACLLFEKIIDKKLQRQGWSEYNLEQTALCNKIQNLSDDNIKDSLFLKTDVFTHFYASEALPFSSLPEERLQQVRVRLDNFRWLRNQVMHGKLDNLKDEGDNKKNDLINYMWSEFAPDSFNDAYSHRKFGQRISDSLFEHTADYMIRAIDEIEIKGRDRAAGYSNEGLRILREDFDNLFELRRKLVQFKNYLDVWLPQNATFIHTDILTTIDTTSAYIWMPLVSKKKEKMQSGIYGCSVSLLATPQELRIYMDFGGRAVQERRIYYDFLSGSTEYESLQEKLRGKNGLQVFDVDWYSFRFNELQLNTWLKERDKAVADARQKLTSEPAHIKNPITWNRMLHGFIFSKFDLPPGGFIDFSMIEGPLLDIISLFEAYCSYKNEVERKERKNAKRK